MIDYLNTVVANQWHTWYGTKPPTLDWLLLTNGGTALHDNVVFLGAPKGQRQPLLVAKTCRWPDYSQTIPHEFGQLTAVWQQLGPQAHGRIPRPLHLGQHHADQVLLTDFFAGSLLTQQLRATNDPAALTQLFQRAAVWLRLLHEQTARPRVADLPLCHGTYAGCFANLFALDNQEQAALREVETAVSNHTTAATTQLIQHGDFWPGNILLRATDGQFALIDWQFSAWTTDPNFDLYFLPLAAAVTLAGSGTPQQRGQRVAKTLASWAQTILPTYLTAYGYPMFYHVLPPRLGFLWACLTAAARPVETFGVVQDDALLWRTIFANLAIMKRGLEIMNLHQSPISNL